MSFICGIFQITREGRYRILLFLACLLLLSVSAVGAMAVYRSYCQCREMADREAQQLKRYEVLKDAFDMQKEHVRELTEDTEFIEHVARERMQVADKNEILFRFE